MTTTTELRPQDGQIISENSLRFRDLIPNMLRALPAKRQAEVFEILQLQGSKLAAALVSLCWTSEAGDYLRSDSVFDDTIVIEQALQMYADDYNLWFGIHPDDGACLGFWSRDEE
jgi:hypothetical protein